MKLRVVNNQFFPYLDIYGHINKYTYIYIYTHIYIQTHAHTYIYSSEKHIL